MLQKLSLLIILLFQRHHLMEHTERIIVQHMELTIIILSIIKQRFQLIGEYYLGEIKDTSIYMLLQTCSIQRRMELVPICTKLHIVLLPLDIAQMQT